MSLLELQRDYLISSLKSMKAYESHVIVDETTYNIFLRLLGKNKLLDHCYSCFRIDDESRSAKRDVGIYILEPSQYTLDCLMAEYSKGKRYDHGKLYFLPGLTREQSETIKRNSYLMETIGGTINKLEFLSLNAVEDLTFTCGNTYSNKAYFNYKTIGSEVTAFQIQRAVSSLVNLCILTNEYPIVRYFNSTLSKTIAQRFQHDLNLYYASNAHLSPNETKTIMFITDRTMDLFTPFVHLSYYRSIIFDLLSEDNGLSFKREETLSSFKYKSTAKDNQGKQYKYLTLDQGDNIWLQFKDVDFSQISKKLSVEREKVLTERKKMENAQVNQLGHAFLFAEDVATESEIVQGHLDMYRLANDEVARRKLADLLAIESAYSSKLSGRKEVETGVTDWLLNILASDSIDSYDKIRLICAYTIYRGGLIEEDIHKLIRFSLKDEDKVTSITKLIKNFEHFGYHLIKKDLRDKTVISLSPYHSIRDGNSPGGSSGTSHYPAFANIAYKILTNSLPEVYSKNEIHQHHKPFHSKFKTNSNNYNSNNNLMNDMDDDDEDGVFKDFPYLNGAPIEDEDQQRGNALRQANFNKSRTKFSTTGKNRAADILEKPKMFIFVAGGLTHSELSSIAALEGLTNKKIFIGADELYSTWDFLGDVATIEDRKDPQLPFDKYHSRKRVPDFLAGSRNASTTTLSSSNTNGVSGNSTVSHHQKTSSKSSIDNGKSEKKPSKFLNKFKKLAM